MSEKSLDTNKVIPTVDDLVDSRVSTVKNNEWMVNNYIWRAGWATILLHWLSVGSKSLGVGSLSTAALALTTYFFFIIFQLCSLPYDVCQLYFGFFAPLILLTSGGGVGAMAAGNFLEGKARDEALRLVASEEEQKLLTGGNYVRSIDAIAGNRLTQAILEELTPLYQRQGELKEEIGVYWKTWRDAHKLVDTPTKTQLIARIDAAITTASAELEQVETKIKETHRETDNLRTQIEQLVAHAPLLDIQHKRMLREDQNLLEADSKRHETLDDIRSEVESAMMQIQIESGINPPEPTTEEKTNNKE